jgi:transposase InsO family protein
MLKLTDLYSVAGISKQLAYKYRRQEHARAEQAQLVVCAMKKMRKDHKKMSSRKVYVAQKQKLGIKLGRDKFEQIAFANGYRVKHKRQTHKTTWGQRIEVYSDLVSGLIINNIDQVYQSDIFYLKVAGKDYYGVTIIDAYSSRLVALHLSKSLRATENIIALKKVLKSKNKTVLKGCIFHSDRGTQYISKAQKELLTSLGMRISMCKMPQQNAYAERVQGTLKHEYFYEYLLTESNIARQAAKIMRIYNDERPHLSLNKKTPKAFEEMISKMSETDRPKKKIYEWNDEKCFG